MTRDEIIAMAKEAGSVSATFWPDDFTGLMSVFERFAALVAAAEREACAKVCEEMHDHYSALKDTALLNGNVDLSNASSGEPRACEFLAAAIRQRGAA